MSLLQAIMPTYKAVAILDRLTAMGRAQKQHPENRRPTLPTDLDADRAAVQHHIAAWARHLDRPITVTVTDQDGSWTIAIDPDGATHPRARRKRR